jgi:hypothetical protein
MATAMITWQGAQLIGEKGIAKVCVKPLDHEKDDICKCHNAAITAS